MADKVCRHCSQNIYYSCGYKVWAHEGDRPSFVAKHGAFPKFNAAGHQLSQRSTWGKWIECEGPSGEKLGTEAEPVNNSEAVDKDVHVRNLTMLVKRLVQHIRHSEAPECGDKICSQSMEYLTRTGLILPTDILRVESEATQ